MTPPTLAQKMLSELGVTEAQAGAKLLDPCVGPGTFPRALTSAGARDISVHALDIDLEMVQITRAWATPGALDLTVDTSDYLDTFTGDSYDFAVLNPPYVRQEWIERKGHYRATFLRRYGVDVPGTSNLYVYFIVKVLADLKVGGRMACIVYDSWQTTRFGQWLQAHLLKSCRTIVVEAVPDLPFEGRLIDATIIYAEKGEGATLDTPGMDDFTAQLSGVRPVEQLFATRRGLRLKQADFFMTDLHGVGQHGARPFVKKVNLIPGFVVPEDHPEAALLLTPVHHDSRTLLALERRLAAAHLDPEANVSILTWWRERPDAWAQHADPTSAPLLLNYYLRRRPRHIYNPDRAYSDNFYGLTPRSDDVSPHAWLAALNSTLSVIGVLERARNQGAGLAKLQLFEYRGARVIDLQQWSRPDVAEMAQLGQALASGQGPQTTIASIDELVAAVLGHHELRPDVLAQVLVGVEQRVRRPRDGGSL